MHSILQFKTAQRARVGVPVVNVRLRAARCAGVAIRVPGDKERVLAAARVVPTGEHRARDDVVKTLPFIVVQPHPLAVVERRRLPPRAVWRELCIRHDAIQAVETPAAQTNRIGDDHGTTPQSGSVIQRHHRCARVERKRSQIAPRLRANALVKDHIGHTSGVVHAIMRVGCAIGTGVHPDVERVGPALRHGDAPRRRRRRRARHR